MVDGATVLPLTVFVMDGNTVRPSTETWVGLSCSEADSDRWWNTASARVELSRPEREPQFWLTRIIRSRLPPEADATVMGASPMFGPGYTFPAWPVVVEEN